MSIFIGSNLGDIITPDEVSADVTVIGDPKRPSAAADTIFAGSGDDIVAGGGGNDVAFLGAGNDRFIWNPGDGSDVVDGGSGFDALQFNGANANENVTLSARSGVAFMARDVGNVLMSLSNMERIEFNALGGTDNITVKDMSGAGVTQVAIDLAAALNGTVGDGLVDRVTVEGKQSADTISISNAGGAVDVIGASADVEIKHTDGVDQLTVKGLGGDDTISASNGLGTLIGLTLDGGAGNDTLRGGDGADLLIGGDGNDFVDGNIGSDVALLGTGDDTFQWDPGDGSDLVEGQDGFDTLLFNGSNAGEIMDVSANGARVRFTRNVGNITMDLNSIEQINVRALGGADTINVNDLSGTDVTHVNVDLGSITGEGDGAADTVNVFGSSASESVTVTNSGEAIVVNGLSVVTSVSHAENTDVIGVRAGEGNDTFDISNLSTTVSALVLDGGTGTDIVTLNGSNAGDSINMQLSGDLLAFDNGSHVGSAHLTGVEQLVVSGFDGDDTLSANGLLTGGPQIVFDGGTGDDILRGSAGNDILLGGDGNDFVDGNVGSDFALLGAGDDTFQWDPGDGSDVVEGQDGFDTLGFNGSNIGENMDISANGARVRFTRNVGNITMDLNDMEQINVRALSGNDNITVNDLTGTDAKQVHVDLGSTTGTPDGAADTVTAVATNGDDVVVLAGNGGETVIDGLAAEIHVANMDTLDRISILALGGDDVVDASGTPVVGTTGVFIDGGDGDDVLIGSAGNDIILGGAGDDVLIGGAGTDVLDGGPGDNIVIQDLVGHTTINDFESGQGTIDLSAFGHGQSFDWLLAHAQDVDGNVVFDFGTQQVTLTDQTVAGLHSGDFLI